MSHFRLNASVVTSAQRTGKLDLHGRSLYTVPADVFNAAAFGSLAVLDLSENKLAELPGDIRQLQSLREIYLDNNSLSTLPTELLQLPNLKAITLENNPRLDPALRALYDKAAPLFRSRARDVAPILAWLAGQSQSPSRAASRAMEPSPLQGAGRSIGGFANDRASDRDEPAAARPSYQPSSLAAEDDDDYLYAQMRARAAARAAAADAPAPSRSPFNDSPSPPAQQQQRDYGRDYGRDDRNYDRERDTSPPVAAQSGSHYARGGPAQRESPFAQDAGLKMESRDGPPQQSQQQQGGYSRPSAAIANANDDAAARNKNVQRASNIFGGAEEAPRHGRRAPAYARGGSGSAPFGTDLNASENRRAQAPPQRAPAPFGTDNNAPSLAARRQADPERNYTSVKSPWAVEGTGSAAQPGADGNGERRGVRITRPNERADPSASSPFGTLPASLAAAQYQTSSASAASHVQAAHRIRAQGGLDTHAAHAAAGPISPSHGGSSNPYDDGHISGNGPRNSSGMRNYARPNSDVFGSNDRREIGNFDRDSHPSQGQSHARQSSGFNAPFGRDTDAQAPHPGRGNRNNQSSVFDADAPAPTHGGKSAANRPVKSTSLW